MTALRKARLSRSEAWDNGSECSVERKRGRPRVRAPTNSQTRSTTGLGVLRSSQKSLGQVRSGSTQRPQLNRPPFSRRARHGVAGASQRFCARGSRKRTGREKISAERGQPCHYALTMSSRNLVRLCAVRSSRFINGPRIIENQLCTIAPSTSLRTLAVSSASGSILVHSISSLQGHKWRETVRHKPDGFVLLLVLTQVGPEIWSSLTTPSNAVARVSGRE
jgi:hypothetical protein